MKVTKQQKEKIEELKEKGKSPKEISIELKMGYSTVLYYYNPRIKETKISYQKDYQKKHKPVRGDKYRDYQRKYHNKRYWRLKEEENQLNKSRH